MSGTTDFYQETFLLRVLWPGGSSPLLHIELWVKSSEGRASTLYWDRKTRKTFLSNPKELAELESWAHREFPFISGRKGRRGCLQWRQKGVYQHDGKLAPEQCTVPVSLVCWQSKITIKNRTRDSAISKVSLEGKVLKCLAINYHRKKEREINEKTSYTISTPITSSVLDEEIISWQSLVEK